MSTLIKRAEQDWERVVMTELLIPNTPNVYGDITTPEAIKEFVYQFAIQGFGIDVEHNHTDVQGQKLVIVESFIARPGDPDFIVGSWVVGMKILDDDLWQQVLDCELTGFSYEAVCQVQEIMFQNLRNREIVGVTEPDPIDGHTHAYLVLLDPRNRPISGGTGETDGHSHTITNHSFTDAAEGHKHRYQVIQ